MTKPTVDLAEIVETMKAAHSAIRGSRLADQAVRADLRQQIARAERALALTEHVFPIATHKR